MSLSKKSLSVTIQMKAIELYSPLALFVTLYKVVLSFESVNESLKMIIQMKAVEWYFDVVLLFFASSPF